MYIYALIKVCIHRKSNWPENEVQSSRESIRLRETWWELSFWRPKKPLFNSCGQITDLFLKSLLPAGKWKWSLASYFSLAILNQKKKVFFSPAKRLWICHPNFSCDYTLFFQRDIVEAYYLLLLLNMRNRQTNKQKHVIWKDNQWKYQVVRKVICQGHILLLHVPISGVPFGWSSVPMESKPGLKWLQCVLLNVSA